MPYVAKLFVGTGEFIGAESEIKEKTFCLNLKPSIVKRGSRMLSGKLLQTAAAECLKIRLEMTSLVLCLHGKFLKMNARTDWFIIIK